MADKHADFLGRPRARALVRGSGPGARIYYVWDGRSRGLGEISLGRDPERAIELWERYESGEIKEPTATPKRIAALKYRSRPADDPYMALPRWARAIYVGAESRAKLAGRTFSLTPVEMALIVDRCAGRCEVSGLHLLLEEEGEKPGTRPFAPSLDRIDSSAGYELGNCRIVCVIANFAMNHWGEAPLLVLAKAIVGMKTGTDR